MNRLLFVWLTLFRVVVSLGQNQYYSDIDQNFSIQFPKGWYEAVPVGPNIKVLYIDDFNSNINILVKSLVNQDLVDDFRNNYPELKNSSNSEISEFINESFDYRYLTSLEIEALLNLAIPELMNSSRNFKIKEKGVRTINKVKFAFFESTTDILIAGYTSTYCIIHYQTNYKGKNYSISGKYLIENASTARTEIINSIQSFRLLDYEVTNINTELINDNVIEDGEDLLLFLRIILTFTICFFIYVVYRKHRKNQTTNQTYNKSDFTTSKKEYSNNKDSEKTEDDTDKNEHSRADDSSQETGYIDLEKYEEIDETSLTDFQKSEVYGKILGLNGRISKSDITKAWKDMLDKYHPDRVSHLGIEFQIFAEKKTKDINKAYLYFKKKYNL